MFSALLLRSHLEDLNLRAAFLHLVGDAATSLAVIVSGLIVWAWDWSYADPIVSIVVSIWIGRAAFGIVRRAVNVLMEGTPEEIEFEDVQEAIAKIPGVVGVHDLHIWSISSADLALSAHLELTETPLSETGEVLVAVKEMLARDFSIGHATLETEFHGAECAGSTCDITPKTLSEDHRSAGHTHSH